MTTDTYDAIVVGARCAGAPTAMLLARRGYHVLLVDRDHFPSDVISTHFIWPRGIRYLQEWGLVDAVLATNCPPIPASVTYFGPQVIEEVFAETAPADFGLCPRRIRLDQLLIDAAVDAGVELRTGFSVDALLEEDGSVAGISGRHDGQSVVERARVVIGADGLHSRIARLVDAEEYERVPTVIAAYYAYWSGVEMENIELYAAVPGSGGTIAMPTNDGQMIAGTAFPRERASEVRADVERAYLAVNEQAAHGLWERMRAGRRESPFRGMVDLPHYIRKPYGAGWALVGDAGYHVDPTLGYGISNAFGQMDLLTSALDDVFQQRRSFDDAMSEYQRERDESLRPWYERNLAIARTVPAHE